MKLLKTILFSLFICGILSFTLSGPQVKKIATKSLSFNPVISSTDRDGNIYLVSDENDIFKLDKDGKLLVTYSPQKMAETTVFEAWNSVSLIIYYKDFQEYVMLDRFLTEKSSGKLNEEFIGFSRVTTLASDNNLWLIDDTDFSLKKYDLKFNNLKTHTPLDLLLDPKDYHITFIREYHNQLYVLDETNGVLVFDILGNYKKTLPLKGVKNIGFYNDYLYYPEKGQLVMYNLYSGTSEQVNIDSLQADSPIIISNNRLYHAQKKKLDVYEISGL